MINASLISKRDAAVKFFHNRQCLDAFKVNDTDDLLGFKLLQWENVDKIYRIKPTMDLSRELTYTKADLEKVDAIMFMCENYAWREVYAVKCTELEKHLDEAGNGKINISAIPCSSYFYFNMSKALQWINER